MRDDRDRMAGEELAKEAVLLRNASTDAQELRKFLMRIRRRASAH
jgi:hypothetical protein